MKKKKIKLPIKKLYGKLSLKIAKKKVKIIRNLWKKKQIRKTLTYKYNDNKLKKVF